MVRNIAFRFRISLNLISFLLFFENNSFAIYANYDADAQRQRVRRDVRTKVWGKPAKVIHAKYKR